MGKVPAGLAAWIAKNKGRKGKKTTKIDKTEAAYPDKHPPMKSSMPKKKGHYGKG